MDAQDEVTADPLGSSDLRFIQADDPSDSDWTSESHATGAATAVPCFASRLEHTDASRLLEWGVWLGDYDNPEKPVTGLSFTDLMRKCVDSDKLNPESKGTRPRLVTYFNRNSKDAQCLSCKGRGRRTDRMAIVQRPVDKSRNIWTFPCHLGDNLVFALVKSGATTWSFYLNGGGYVQPALLTTLVNHEVSQRRASLRCELNDNMSHIPPSVSRRALPLPTMTPSPSLAKRLRAVDTALAEDEGAKRSQVHKEEAIGAILTLHGLSRKVFVTLFRTQTLGEVILAIEEKLASMLDAEVCADQLSIVYHGRGSEDVECQLSRSDEIGWELFANGVLGQKPQMPMEIRVYTK